MEANLTRPQTARQANLGSCPRCHLLCRLPSNAADGEAACPRCGAVLHARKPKSISRTWALVIAAIIFYVPAMMLPISITTALGTAEGDTIMSGVIYFIHSGSWSIALIIFVASILVPVLKILILFYLLVSVQLRSRRQLRDRTRLYRIIEAVGRWSMVDIYVITIMAAIINLGGLATFEVGPAAVYFGAVVVLTMFAAMSFDPRLIWDPVE